MQKPKSRVIFRALLVAMMLMSFTGVASAMELSTLSSGHQSTVFQMAGDDCVIPPSGPWPPCATGGNTGGSSGSEDCVIPPSGPWPPCATGGNTGGSSGSGGSDECVIPPSGPWPPCATGGNTGGSSGSGGSDECVIPPSGPWPPCATGGDSGQTPAPAPAPAPDPAPAPAPAPAPEPAPPSNPGNTNVLNIDGSFLTGLTVLGTSSHTMDVRVHYETANPAEFIPVMLVFDPVNCFEWCAEVTSGEQFFPIKGQGLLTSDQFPGPAVGSLDIEVAIDNVFCPFAPHSTVLGVALFNAYDAIFNGGEINVDGLMLVEVDHHWCNG